MLDKVNFTPIVRSSGRIENLPFITDGSPVSIMLIQKPPYNVPLPLLSIGGDIIMDVQLYRDAQSSPLCIATQSPKPIWSDFIYKSFDASEINAQALALYDIYWRSADANPSFVSQPNNQGYIGSETFQNANGSFTHGEILSLPFSLGAPFKIICCSKEVNPANPDNLFPGDAIFLDLKLNQASSIGRTFVHLRKFSGQDPTWTDMNIQRIPSSEHNISVFSKMRIFWIGGEYAKPE